MNKTRTQRLLLVGVLLVIGAFVVKSLLPRHVDASDWVVSLRTAAANADRLVVHDLDFSGKGAQPDFEIEGAAKVRELLQIIHINPAESGFHCMCDGEYWIHLYSGDQEVAVLGYHHGRSLRWHKGSWKGDGLLTAAAQEALPAWFQRNGCSYLQDVRDRELARRRQQIEEDQQFAAFFPENVRGLFLERDRDGPLENEESRGKKIVEGMDNPEAVSIAVCRALGSVRMSWTTTTDKERRALAAVHLIDGRQFLAALERLQEDRGGLLGAARVFFREGYHRKVPAEARIEWVLRLAKCVLNEGMDDDKPGLLRFLEKEQDPSIRSLLQDVFRGKVGKEIDRADAFGEEPRLRAGAALSLVMMGDDSIKPEIEKLLPQTKDRPDAAALEICLALLGDPSHVRAEHFRLQSYSIGLAGLEAIERFKGKQGMEALVKGGIHHPWGHVNDEALLTFERITGRKLTRGEIEDWWEVEHEGKGNRPKPVLILAGNTDQLRCVAFSRQGDLIASGSNDSTAKVWDAKSGKKLFTLEGHDFTVIDVAFHPDGKHLATASGDTTIKIWNLTTGKEIRTLAGHTHHVERVAYNPDGTSLASSSEDGTVRIWDPSTGNARTTFRGHRVRVISLAFRPDGRRIASGSGDGIVLIWNPADGEIEWSLPERAASISYSADGKYLATACGKSVKLWESSSGKLLRTFDGHTENVESVAFSPDGKHIASTSWDKLVKIWGVSAGRELVSFKAHPEWVNAVAYSPDGKRLATGSEDKTIRIWDLDRILAAAASPIEKK
jgi:WD40 repeat protein